MGVKRLEGIPGFSIDRVAAAAGGGAGGAGDDAKVLSLKNLDRDLLPPAAAIEATRASVGLDDANSYLPFTGSVRLRQAVAERLTLQTGHAYERGQVVIT